VTYEPYVSKYVPTEAEPISAERYDDMLNVLPPSRWYRGHVQYFHVCEHLTGDLVSWFIKCGDSHYEFNGSCRMTHGEIIDKLNAARAKEAA
jgi:hypothetical protein